MVEEKVSFEAKIFPLKWSVLEQQWIHVVTARGPPVVGQAPPNDALCSNFHLAVPLLDFFLFFFSLHLMHE